MKDDYSSIFRNIKTARKDPTESYRSHRPIPEPWWVAILGGAAMGVALAFLFWLAV